jgi:superfamily II DNA or RNA helicase
MDAVDCHCGSSLVVLIGLTTTPIFFTLGCHNLLYDLFGDKVSMAERFAFQDLLELYEVALVVYFFHRLTK